MWAGPPPAPLYTAPPSPARPSVAWIACFRLRSAWAICVYVRVALCQDLTWDAAFWKPFCFLVRLGFFFFFDAENLYNFSCVSR